MNRSFNVTGACNPQFHYIVISTDFQMLSHSNFATEGAFVRAFARELSAAIGIDIYVPDEIKRQLQIFAKDKTQDADLGDLFYVLSSWCAESERPVVLITAHGI